MPRIPSGSQSPVNRSPSLSVGTLMNRIVGSSGVTQITLWRSAALESEAKILRPVSRQPPSAGTASVATPAVAPGAFPSLKGWAWMWPSAITPAYMAARRRSWVARSTGDISRSSAICPQSNIVAVCMLKVSAVDPQCRPSSSDTSP